MAIGGLLTSLVTAIGILFRALLKAKDDQIKREQDLTGKLLPAMENNTKTLERVLEIIQIEQQNQYQRTSARGRKE